MKVAGVYDLSCSPGASVAVSVKMLEWGRAVNLATVDDQMGLPDEGVLLDSGSRIDVPGPK